MSQFTSMNVEQSVAKFLADLFVTAGYKIYWKDTGQTQGTGSTVITLLRDFPPSANLLIKQSSVLAPGEIKVPAFAISAGSPTTSYAERMGIGETIFRRTMNIRIDGFVDTEMQWYKFETLFTTWFNPDIRISLYDQETNINNPAPTAATQKIHLEYTQVFRRELDYDTAARYYLLVGSLATFIE